MLKQLRFILITSLLLINILAQSQMILEYEVTDEDLEIVIPFGVIGGVPNCVVDWGDGTPTWNVVGPGLYPHIYSTSGIKTVTISGTLSHFGFNSTDQWDGFNTHQIEEIRNNSLVKVVSWGGLEIYSLENAFYYAQQLIQVPTAAPLNINTLKNTFRNSSFNYPIDTWDVSNVRSMEGTFASCPFNQPLNSWDVSNVSNMYQMFDHCRSFNQPLNNWDVSKVTVMSTMFANCDEFNQPLNNWDVSKVTNMQFMFRWSKKFNQSLGSWDISNVRTMTWMFYAGKLCTENYDATLNGWAYQMVLSDVDFGAGRSKHSSSSVEAREILINKGWSIEDEGEDLDGTETCQVVGVINEMALNNIHTFPNPATNKLHIDFSNIISTNVVIEISDIMGRAISTHRKDIENTTTIDISNLRSGQYLVHIFNKNNFVTIPFVKEY